MIFQQNSFQKPIFFDNDGGIDDLVTLLVLLTLDQYRLTGVALTNGVSPIEKSSEAIAKLFSLFCRYDLQLAKSDVKPVHPFPEKWQNSIDVFLNDEIIQQRTISENQITNHNTLEFMASKILNEAQQTTIIATGPATNLNQFFTQYPEAISKIERIIWMAGTIHKKGNVRENGTLQNKEWNIYWDAQSAKQLLNSSIPILLLPIDTVEQAEIKLDLLNELNKIDSTLGKLVSNIFSQMYARHSKYYFWDVLTVAALLDKNIFTSTKEAPIEILLDEEHYGEIHEITNGVKISYPNHLNTELFIKKLLNSLKQF